LIDIKNSKLWWIAFGASVLLYLGVGSIASAPGRASWVYTVVNFISLVFLIAALISLVTAIILTRSEKRHKKSLEYYSAGLQAMNGGDWETAKEQFMLANSQGHATSDAKIDEVIHFEAQGYFDQGLQAFSENRRDDAEKWFIKAKVWEHPGADAKLAEIKSII